MYTKMFRKYQKNPMLIYNVAGKNSFQGTIKAKAAT
jgi:hypothetical protein